MKKKPKTKEETELFAARAARRRLESRQPDLDPYPWDAVPSYRPDRPNRKNIPKVVWILPGEWNDAIRSEYEHGTILIECDPDEPVPREAGGAYRKAAM